MSVLAATGYLHFTNIAGWPTLENDDEGTYMARAWAVQTGRGAHHSLSNYSYWYDHVPFGWMQLVPWTWLTAAFRPGTIADVDGRQIMVVYALVSTYLVYVIARRLAASRLAAIGAMVLFGFSPIALAYTRQIYLDTVGLPWLLAALALALTPRRNLWTYVASGACFAAACLSKETYLLLAPMLYYVIWQRADAPSRRMCLVVFSCITLGLLSLYPLYAALKGELIPGKGHVSLIGAIEWQLAQRSGSGSIMRAGSAAQEKVLRWYHSDPWLVGGGVGAIIPASFVQRFRPLAAALVVPMAYLLHGGYVPAMYIEGFLPLFAILVACYLDVVVRYRPAAVWTQGSKRERRRADVSKAASMLAIAGLGIATSQLVPSWASEDRAALGTHDNTALFSAEQYVERHVPRSATLVVDSNVWIDLVDDGYLPSHVVWFWELTTDPDVTRRYPEGWRQMDYVIASNTIRVDIGSSVSSGRPVAAAIEHSTQIAHFGKGYNAVEIYRVHPNQLGQVPKWLPWWLRS